MQRRSADRERSWVYKTLSSEGQVKSLQQFLSLQQSNFALTKTITFEMKLIASAAYLFSLTSIASSVIAAPAARSGSALDSFADDACTKNLSHIKDVANDGVQGTHCQSLKVIHRTDNTLYRNLAQSVLLSDFQNGCTAYVFSGPNCHDDSIIAQFTKDDDKCQSLQGYGESFQIRCE